MNSLIYDYIVEDKEEVKKAEPKVSDYRERFKKRELTMEDIRPQVKRPLVKEETPAEEQMLIGPGLEEDWL